MKIQRFIKQSEVDAPPEIVFAWHEQPGAVERLTPPWERVEVLERPPMRAGLRVGTRVVFKVYTGPFWRLWVAEHTEYEPPHLFADIQRRGPFAYWYHRHRFEKTSRGATLMTDEIEYALPMGWLGELAAGDFTRDKLRRMFDYRHRVVAEQVGVVAGRPSTPFVNPWRSGVILF
jgi:ligand-binding SRPBCC domain-containing protein